MAKTVTSPAGSSERRAGYTLIELMVVLLIIGAALSLALPRLDSFLPQLRLKQTAREVVLALREAQRQAIQGGRPTTVALDLAHRRLLGPGRKFRAARPALQPAADIGAAGGRGNAAGPDRIFPRRHLDRRPAAARLWRAEL